MFIHCRLFFIVLDKEKQIIIAGIREQLHVILELIAPYPALLLLLAHRPHLD